MPVIYNIIHAWRSKTKVEKREQKRGKKGHPMFTYISFSLIRLFLFTVEIVTMECLKTMRIEQTRVCLIFYIFVPLISCPKGSLGSLELTGAHCSSL